MSTPTPEEAFLEYARGTGWDETAVRVVLDTVRKARRAAALEMRERCAALAEEFPVHWVDVSAGESYLAGPVHEEIADAVRSLGVP